MPLSLRAIRIRAGLSQEQLADRLQISRPHVSRLETGTREVDLALAERWIKECGQELAILDPDRDKAALLIARLSDSDRDLILRLADLMPLDPGYEVSLRGLIETWEKVVRSAGDCKGNVKTGTG